MELYLRRVLGPSLFSSVVGGIFWAIAECVLGGRSEVAFCTGFLGGGGAVRPPVAWTSVSLGSEGLGRRGVAETRVSPGSSQAVPASGPRFADL